MPALPPKPNDSIMGLDDDESPQKTTPIPPPPPPPKPHPKPSNVPEPV